MSYQRLFLHYGANQTDFKGVLSQRAVKKCWFELYRQGGCGAGQIRLGDDFLNRNQVEPGDWIACEYTTGDRWYFGRVEKVQSDSPSGMLIQLEGPGVELNEVFPGAMSPTALGMKPHRYARTDLFPFDPDGSMESVDVVMNSAELIRKLLEQYVVPSTKIKYVPALVETGPLADDVTSVKFRGEESVRSIIKEMAVRARNASWGVDAQGQFFFLQQKTGLQATYEEDLDLTRLRETRSRELLFNRVVLTGDYVYDRSDNSLQLARRSFRWRGNYRQPESIATFGERRIRMSVPWIRSREDSRSFVTEFFRIYSQPVSQYSFETAPQSTLPVPWLGQVKLLDRSGTVLSQLQPEKIRVLFDHEPQFQMELGPVDPREFWPEPPQDERWELPENVSDYGGSDLSVDGPPFPSDNSLSSSSDGGSDDGGGNSSSNVSSSSSLLTSSLLTSSLLSSSLLSSSLLSSSLLSSGYSSSGENSSSGGTSLSGPSSSVGGSSSVLSSDAGSSNLGQSSTVASSQSQASSLSGGLSSSADSSAGDSSAENSSAENSSAGNSSAGNSSAGNSSAGNSSGGNRSGGNSSGGNSSGGNFSQPGSSGGNSSGVSSGWISSGGGTSLPGTSSGSLGSSSGLSSAGNSSSFYGSSNYYGSSSQP